MHVPVQAVLQQTPSTQKPLWQSRSQPQASPGIPAAVPPAVQPPAASVDPSMVAGPLFDEPHAPRPTTTTTATTASAERITDELTARTPRKWA